MKCTRNDTDDCGGENYGFGYIPMNKEQWCVDTNKAETT